MAHTIPSLWPEEFGTMTEVPPVAILREQAALLGEKTRNIVEARVRTTTAGEGRFVHGFELVAPILDDYIYPLFSVSHDIRLYPLTLEVFGPERSSTSTRVASQEELVSCLRDVFAAPHTRAVMQALITQSKS